VFSLREDDKMERRLQGDVENKVGANGFSAWRYSTFEFFSRVYVQVYDMLWLILLIHTFRFHIVC